MNARRVALAAPVSLIVVDERMRDVVSRSPLEVCCSVRDRRHIDRMEPGNAVMIPTKHRRKRDMHGTPGRHHSPESSARLRHRPAWPTQSMLAWRRRNGIVCVVSARIATGVDAARRRRNARRSRRRRHAEVRLIDDRHGHDNDWHSHTRRPWRRDGRRISRSSSGRWKQPASWDRSATPDRLCWSRCPACWSDRSSPAHPALSSDRRSSPDQRRSSDR